MTAGQNIWNRSLQNIERWLDTERDNLANWIPVGLGCGIVIWQFAGDEGVVFLGLFALALAAVGFAIGPELRTRAVLLGAAITLAVGFAAISAKSAIVAEPVLGKIWIGQFYGRVIKVEHLAARGVIRLELETDRHQNLPPVVRVNLSPEQFKPVFSHGSIILLRARLMPPAGPALPGGYDFARRAWFSGIGATGSALGAVTLHQQSPTYSLFSSLRADLTTHVRNSMPGESGAIGSALITGDQGAISEEDADAMRNSGMAHLLSISGLHVTAVVGAIFLLVSRLLSLIPGLALRITVPIIAAAFSAVGAVGYTLLTGAEVPTIRSCVAALLVLTALVLGRDALTLRLVAFGASFVLLFWPEALAGPSFQLSFAAVITIVVLHELQWMQQLVARREEGQFIRLLRGLSSLLITGVAIELILAPIALFHFHKAGLYGALANVVAIPLTTFFIMPLEALALVFDVAGLGAPFWWLAGQGVNAILAIAHYINGLPGSVSMLPTMPVWAFAAMILGALVAGLLKSKWRSIGILPFVVGMVAMLAAPRPDLLITGDGKHLAIVSQEGEVALLRDGAGDYVRDMMMESAGVAAEPLQITAWPGARCSKDICIFDIEHEERRWAVLATRTRYLVPSMELAAACKRVDIAISDRWLPWSCKPRWFKADRGSLTQSGGLAVYLADNHVETVASSNAHAPWVKAAKIAVAEGEAYKAKAPAKASPKPGPY